MGIDTVAGQLVGDRGLAGEALVAGQERGLGHAAFVEATRSSKGKFLGNGIDQGRTDCAACPGLIQHAAQLIVHPHMRLGQEAEGHERKGQPGAEVSEPLRSSDHGGPAESSSPATMA